jgi:hypothetical protein
MKTLSPNTIGLEEPGPGISAFHTMFSESLHFSGAFDSATMAAPVGPRKRGQSVEVAACSETEVKTRARRDFMAAGKPRVPGKVTHHGSTTAPCAVVCQTPRDDS